MIQSSSGAGGHAAGAHAAGAGLDDLQISTRMTSKVGFFGKDEAV